jgi:hypothetical protein
VFPLNVSQVALVPWVEKKKAQAELTNVVSLGSGRTRRIC